MNETATKKYRIEGQNFPLNKTWNTDDISFTDKSGSVAFCIVSQVQDTSTIECSLSDSIASGPVTVKVNVGDQSAEYTYNQNAEKKSSKQNIGVIVGPIIAGVVAVSAVAAFLFYRSKQKSITENNVELQQTQPVTAPQQSADKWNIDFTELSIEKQIGKGGFGVIYLAKYGM